MGSSCECGHLNWPRLGGVSSPILAPPRALIEVLLGRRALPAAALRRAMDKAVASGALDPQAVLIDPRRLAGHGA